MSVISLSSFDVSPTLLSTASTLSFTLFTSSFVAKSPIFVPPIIALPSLSVEICTPLYVPPVTLPVVPSTLKLSPTDKSPPTVTSPVVVILPPLIVVEPLPFANVVPSVVVVTLVFPT